MLLADPISPESQHQQIDFDPPDNTDDQDGNGGGDHNDPSNWITIATFWQPTEAHIARLKLESEEIDCLLIDENLVATDWLYANAVGGIKLRVPEAEAGRAITILARPHGNLDPDDPAALNTASRLGGNSRMPILILLFATAIILMALLVAI
jgi:hypothetical protein